VYGGVSTKVRAAAVVGAIFKMVVPVPLEFAAYAPKLVLGVKSAE
jgi:hypothetical protein